MVEILYTANNAQRLMLQLCGKGQLFKTHVFILHDVES